VLDVEMRRAKALHLLLRPASAVLIGSSVAYRGIEPASEDLYNAGIASLMASELPIAAALAAVRAERRAVLIGLDYFMFTDFSAPVHLERSLGRTEGRLKLLASSVLSFHAFRSVWAKQARLEPGVWRRNGFRTTPDRPPHLTRAIAAAQRPNMKPYDARRLALLEDALDLLRDRQVVLYLSPVSRAQRAGLLEEGLAGDFERWRKDVSALASARTMPFYDLVDLDTRDSFDPEHGSSETWFDNLHFKPSLGARVLETVTVALQPQRREHEAHRR
jgi:hypothetical protein